MTTSPDQTDLDDLASPGRWVFEGHQAASRYLRDADQTAASQELRRELVRLEASAVTSVDAQLAVEACFLLGATLANSYRADAVGPAGRIALLEAVVVLHDSIEGFRLDLLRGSAPLERNATRLLSTIAGMSSEDIAEGEHYGDLVVATAALIAHIRYERVPSR